MQVSQSYPAVRTAAHYTARHRHRLPGGAYTGWSEGVANGRHNHGIEDSERLGYIAASVGSPAHRHAWSLHTRKRIESGYTSGPLLERPLLPAIHWIGRLLGR
jgi:hypothetical protein